MDKKSKILLIIVVLVTFVSAGYTFYKTVVKQDFITVDTTQEEIPETSSI